MKVRNIVPVAEPVTIASKETTHREEVRVCVAWKDGVKIVDLRVWDIASDGSAIPHNGGFLFTVEEASTLRDALGSIGL